mgnify:CR=1 FL=1
MNYGLTLIVIANAFIDTKKFYNQTMQQLLYTIISILILPDNPKAPSLFVTILNSFLPCKLKDLIWFAWICLAVLIRLGYMARVARHINTPSTTLMACTKLLSPSIMAVMVFRILPLEVIQQECRFISLSAGLCYIFITIKIVVFCIARMAYSTLQ